MTAENRTDSRQQQAKQQLIQPTIRVILALFILGIIQFLIVRVPGIEQVVIEPDITIGTIVYSVIALIMFGAVLRYATQIGTVFANIFESIPELKRIFQLIGVLIVLIWAYQVFWWLPYFRENPTRYDYVFLILGVIFVGWLGYLLYSNVDKLSAALTGQVMQTIESEPATATEGPSEPTEETSPIPSDSVETSPESGDVEPTDSISTDSGETPAPSDTTQASDTIYCPGCGTELPADASFCSSCGESIPDSVK